MPGVGVGVSPALRRRRGNATIAQLVEALAGAHWSGDEGKAGDPVTAWARAAGTAYDDWAAVAGAADAGDSLDFVPTDYYNIDGTLADFTTLHKDGCIQKYVLSIDVDGSRVIVDNNVGGNASQRGINVSKYTGGNSWYVTNGTGTVLAGCFRGSGYPRSGSPIDEYHLLEVGWHPEVGAWMRINGDIAWHVDLVGSPSSSAPAYKPRLGERAAATGLPFDGHIADVVWLPDSAVAEAAQLRTLDTMLASGSPSAIALDGAEAVAGSGDPGLVLPSTLRITQSQPVKVFKRGLSNADGQDTRLSLAPAGSANAYDVLGNAFSLYNGTANTQTLTVAAGGYSETPSLVTLAAPSTTPSAHGVVFLGDSRTAAAGTSFVSRMNSYFSSGVTFLGTQGTTPKHEGHPGRTIDWLRNDAASPLTSGASTLDLSGYHTTIGATPDTYFIHIGVNDCITTITSGTTPEENWATFTAGELDRLQDIIDAIHAIDSAINIIICTEPFGPSVTSIWTGGGYTDAKRIIYRNFIDTWNGAIVSRWGDSEASNIYVVPLHIYLDPRHDWSGSDPIHYLTTAGRGHEKAFDAMLATFGALL